MRATVLEPRRWQEGAFLAGAVLLSLALHASLAGGVSRIPEREVSEPVWVEMAIAEPSPAPVQPAPEPEPDVPEPDVPEPEPPPEPEVVEFKPEPERQPDTPPPPEAKPVPRVVQGLDNDSFLEGSGTNLGVRAGTTTAAKATDELMSLEEADTSAVVPYAHVSKAPKIRFPPTVELPDAVRSGEVEGRVEVVLTIDADGRVSDVEVVQSLHPEADAACTAGLRRSRWKAGTKDGVAVIVRNVPYSCRFEAIDG